MNIATVVSWRNYLPSIFLFLLGFLFFVFPLLAALLVGGVLFFVSVLYGWLVFRFHQMIKMGTRPDSPFFQEVYEHGGPNFRTVTVSLIKGRDWQRAPRGPH